MIHEMRFSEEPALARAARGAVEAERVWLAREGLLAKLDQPVGDEIDEHEEYEDVEAEERHAEVAATQP
jgi:hypothetical protein